MKVTATVACDNERGQRAARRGARIRFLPRSCRTMSPEKSADCGKIGKVQAKPGKHAAESIGRNGVATIVTLETTNSCGRQCSRSSATPLILNCRVVPWPYGQGERR